MLKVFHSDKYVPELPDGHRFPIGKYQLIREQLLYEGTLEIDQFEESHPVAEEAILRIHERQYWEAVRDLKLDGRSMRKIGFPQSPTLVDRSRRSCQGTLSAALHALDHGIGMNIAGGTHHAFAGHGEGFCVLNDLAISSSFLLEEKLVKKVLIVDLDVHQGNGTAKIFEDEPRVFTFSMHGAHNYPLKKEKSDIDIPLDNFTGDDLYLKILDDQLLRLINSVKPDIIFYQSGVDVLETDRLGKLSLSREGCKKRDRMVIGMAAEKQVPLAVCIGGGYSERLIDTVEAHSNTFRTAVEVYK
ncbi:MAG: histone deacetylase [Bacteroidia bacterium]|nr:histone deacetylase [Bacteroidia bacterium]